MTTFENTFIRGPSPSYSEDVTSENGMSTLPIGDRNDLNENFPHFNEYQNKYENHLFQKNYPIRGRNTFAFWVIVSLLLILTVGNLLLTITIVSVLRLGKGMQSIEIIPEEEVVKFFGVADLDRIYKRDGSIEGFTDDPVSIEGEGVGSVVNINVNRHGTLHSKIQIDEEGISVKGISSFEMKDPLSGEIIFTTHRPKYNLPQGAESLVSKVVSSSRITSPLDRPLTVHTDDKLSIRGSEGIYAEASMISLSSSGNILVNNTQGTTTLISGEGIFLNMNNIPIINSEHGIRTGAIQYKICVCMPQGKLFRVSIPRNHNGGKISCTHFNPAHDPCL